MENFHQPDTHMSVKMHFLRSYLDSFPNNFEEFIEEQDKYSYQDINVMKERYQAQWDVNFLVDYRWCLKSNVEPTRHKRKSWKRPFIEKFP